MRSLSGTSRRADILQKIRKGGLQILKEFNRKRYEMGQRIRKLRKRCDLCQEALAEMLGVSQVTVSRIENGDTKMDVEMLVRLSAILPAPLNVRERGYEDGCGDAGASVCHTTGTFKCDRWGNR